MPPDQHSDRTVHQKVMHGEYPFTLTGPAAQYRSAIPVLDGIPGRGRVLERLLCTALVYDAIHYVHSALGFHEAAYPRH